jgi:hypothetical protein
MIACVSEAGFDVEPYGDDGMSANVSPDQQSAFEAAQKKCQDDLDLFPVHELTSADFDSLYTQSLEAAECLEAHGYDIPEAPSRQAFEDDYQTNAWVPHGYVTGISGTEFAKLEKECPQPTVD